MFLSSVYFDEVEFILGIQLIDVRSKYVLSLYWATATATSTGYVLQTSYSYF